MKIVHSIIVLILFVLTCTDHELENPLDNNSQSYIQKAQYLNCAFGDLIDKETGKKVDETVLQVNRTYFLYYTFSDSTVVEKYKLEDGGYYNSYNKQRKVTDRGNYFELFIPTVSTFSLKLQVENIYKSDVKSITLSFHDFYAKKLNVTDTVFINLTDPVIPQHFPDFDSDTSKNLFYIYKIKTDEESTFTIFKDSITTTKNGVKNSSTGMYEFIDTSITSNVSYITNSKNYSVDILLKSVNDLSIDSTVLQYNYRSPSNTYYVLKRIRAANSSATVRNLQIFVDKPLIKSLKEHFSDSILWDAKSADLIRSYDEYFTTLTYEIDPSHYINEWNSDKIVDTSITIEYEDFYSYRNQLHIPITFYPSRTIFTDQETFIVSDNDDITIPFNYPMNSVFIDNRYVMTITINNGLEEEISDTVYSSFLLKGRTLKLGINSVVFKRYYYGKDDAVHTSPLLESKTVKVQYYKPPITLSLIPDTVVGNFYGQNTSIASGKDDFIITKHFLDDVNAEIKYINYTQACYISIRKYTFQYNQFFENVDTLYFTYVYKLVENFLVYPNYKPYFKTEVIFARGDTATYTSYLKLNFTKTE